MKALSISILTVIVLLLWGIPSSYAQTVSISLADYTPKNPMCMDDFVLGATIDVSVSGTGTASYTSITTYYLGGYIGNQTQNYPSGQALPYTANDIWITRAFGYGTLPDNGTVEVLVEAEVSGTIYSKTFTLNCTTLVANLPSTPPTPTPPPPVPTDNSATVSTGPSIVYPPDNRINWQYGDTNVGILYAGADGALDLYDYETASYIFNFITPDDIAAYIDNPPQSNELILKLGRISVYVLNTGQIQFNFGPDKEGKIWAFIMNDLSDYEAEDSYYIDPNE